MDREHIKYTISHKAAFLDIEKQLTGKNTIRGYLHDTDKLLLYLISSPESSWISKWHRDHSGHHHKMAKTKADYIQMVIDWECARYTKPDKPLNARDTLYQIYPELINIITPILEELNL